MHVCICEQYIHLDIHSFRICVCQCKIDMSFDIWLPPFNTRTQPNNKTYLTVEIEKVRIFGLLALLAEGKYVVQKPKVFTLF